MLDGSPGRLTLRRLTRLATDGLFNADLRASFVADTASFLEGQGIPVDLPRIEIELAKLWGPAAGQIGGPEIENPHVTRIVLANLVVACLEGDCGS